MRRKQFSLQIRNAYGVALLTLLFIAAVSAEPARAQTYTVLHEFTASPDGSQPNPLIRDAQGNLYGTTKYGGLASCGLGSCGTVFKIDAAGNYTILFDFPGGSAGTNPVAGLVRDAKGNLYGTTQGNGVIDGGSVIFKLDPQGRETFIEADGPEASALDSPLTLDEHGNLYGMAPYGGSVCGLNRSGASCGTLYQVTPAGEIKVLHAFDGTDGMQPEGGLVRDSQGNLYGATVFGGIATCESPGYGSYPQPGCGTLYKLDVDGKLTVLHTFTGQADGSLPLGLTIDAEGNLYGIAEYGGDITGPYLYGLGTIFKVDTAGNFSVVFTFTPNTTRNPYYASHLLIDSKGNLYGAQQFNNCALAGGCVFKIDPKGNYTDLYDFPGLGETDDGNQPMGLVFGSHGDVYGSMFIGGTDEPDCQDGCGTVFHLAP